MAGKIRILMYWGYHRKAWTKPFEELSDEFEFIYIFHFDKTSEIEHRVDLNIRYFSEFRSTSHLLDSLNPDRVVFIGLDGVLSMLINHAAVRRRIKTLVIQHGFLYHLKDKIREFHQEKLSDNNESRLEDKEPQSDRKYNASFILRSINLSNGLFFLKAVWTRRKNTTRSEHEWLLGFKSSSRLADIYLLFSPYFSNLYEERDNVSDRIEYFGNPEADGILIEATSYTTNLNSPYLLHIDQPILHSYQLGTHAKFSLTNGTVFYEELADYAFDQGLKLKVKLHPYSFSYLELYPVHENIEYIEQHDSLSQLIMESSKVTGFYSTLILPAILLKPTILFQITDDLDFVEDLKSYGVVNVLPVSFKRETLNQSFIEIEDRDFESLSKFKFDFFYNIDGKSISRLSDKLKIH